MTKTQQRLIVTYRGIFPKDTYRSISIKTNIQQTRLFRIFNGSEMKMSEFEIINSAIRDYSQATHTDFQKISSRCSEILSSEMLNDLTLEMSYLLDMKKRSYK
jgi:predicted transcriptional regulator